MRTSQKRTWPRQFNLTLVLLGAMAGFCAPAFPGNKQAGQAPLKQLTLEQLGNVEVTTASKEPEEVWKTPAAIYVITQEDIRRSGVTSIADALRLAPGVEVGKLSSTTWAMARSEFRQDVTSAGPGEYRK